MIGGLVYIEWRSHCLVPSVRTSAGPAVDQEAERDVQPVRLAHAASRPLGGPHHRQHHGPAREDHDQQGCQQTGEGSHTHGTHTYRHTHRGTHTCRHTQSWVVPASPSGGQGLGGGKVRVHLFIFYYCAYTGISLLNVCLFFLAESFLQSRIQTHNHTQPASSSGASILLRDDRLGGAEDGTSNLLVTIHLLYLLL